MVTDAYNPSSWQAEAEGWWVQGQIGLHNELLANLSYETLSHKVYNDVRRRTGRERKEDMYRKK